MTSIVVPETRAEVPKAKIEIPEFRLCCGGVNEPFSEILKLGFYCGCLMVIQDKITPDLTYYVFADHVFGYGRGDAGLCFEGFVEGFYIRNKVPPEKKADYPVVGLGNLEITINSDRKSGIFKVKRTGENLMQMLKIRFREKEELGWDIKDYEPAILAPIIVKWRRAHPEITEVVFE